MKKSTHINAVYSEKAHGKEIKMSSRTTKTGAGKLWRAIRVVVTIALISYLLYRADLILLGSYLANVTLLPFLGALLLLCLRNAAVAVRWNLVIVAMDRVCAVARLVRYTFIGIFFNLLYPTALGGDVVRGFFLHRHGASRYVAVGSVFLDRFLGVSAMGCMAVFFLLLAGDIVGDRVARLSIQALPFVCLAVALLLFWKRDEAPAADDGRSLIKRLMRTRALLASQFAANKRRFTCAFLLSFAIQLISIGGIFLAARSLGCREPFTSFAVFLPLVSLLSMLPVSIGGFGVREGAFVYFFSFVGMSREMALGICLVWVVLIMAQGLIGGLLFLLEGTKVREIRS